jgi:hypothetical protein
MHDAQTLPNADLFRASDAEADLYETRLRRQSARTWMGIGAVLLVGSAIAFCLAPGRLTLAGCAAGVVRFSRGVLSWRRAVAFEAEAAARRARPWDEREPVDDADASATRLGIDLVLLEKGEVVFRDQIVLTREPSQRVHEVRGNGPTRKYLLSYAFDRPASTLSILAPDYQSSFAMGVHRSTDWERIGIGATGELVFQLVPLP